MTTRAALVTEAARRLGDESADFKTIVDGFFPFVLRDLASSECMPRLRQSAQFDIVTDQRFYLKSDGIVVRGCQTHITISPQADEVLVIPTRALQPDEKSWAVAFAIPGDWEGVKMVVRATSIRPRKSFKKGFEQGTTDAMIIFDDALIPWERVFLCGETLAGSILAMLFALYHRHSYSGCKPALSELMMYGGPGCRI